MLLDSVRLSFDCVDPALLGHFWSAVTGYPVVTNEAAIVRLQGRALRVGELVFREVDRWKAAPNRLQIDLLTDDLEAETARLVGQQVDLQPVRRGWSAWGRARPARRTRTESSGGSCAIPRGTSSRWSRRPL